MTTLNPSQNSTMVHEIAKVETNFVEAVGDEPPQTLVSTMDPLVRALSNQRRKYATLQK